MAEPNGDVPPPSQPNGHIASPAAQPPSSAPAPASSQPAAALPSVPLTSLADPGLSKRPRDARIVHMLLSSLGCTAYQERVPLQLLDFAYRHTSSILSDALHLSPDAYSSQATRSKDPPPGAKDADGQVNMAAVQLAIQSRLQYQFHGGNAGGGLSKEVLMELAEKRNSQALPRVAQNDWGVRLPSERFVLSGVPWGVRDSWETGGDDEEMGDDAMAGIEAPGLDDQADGDEEEDGGGRMEDLFGNGDGADEDTEMAET